MAHRKALSEALLQVSTQLFRDAEGAPIPGSIASEELDASETQTGVPEHVVASMWLTVDLLVGSGGDQFETFALRFAEPSRQFALSTLARGAVEALSRAVLLTDASADLRERARRYLNLELQAAQQMKLVVGNSLFLQQSGIASDQSQEIARLIAVGRGMGFLAHQPGGILKAAHFGEALPSATRLAGRAIIPTDPSRGELMYSELSGVAHSHMHGLAAHAVLPDETSKASEEEVARLKAAKLLSFGYHSMPAALETLTQQLYPMKGWQVEPMRQALTRAVVSWEELWTLWMR